MADKKMVEAITAMDVDFAQWYTDVVKKAELIDYTSVKGCMVDQTGRICDLGELIQSQLDCKIQGNRCRKCISSDVYSGEPYYRRKKIM